MNLIELLASSTFLKMNAFIILNNFYDNDIPMKAGCMVQIGPTDTAPPYLGSPCRASVGTRENILRQATFLTPFLHSLLPCADGATTLSLLDPWL